MKEDICVFSSVLSGEYWSGVFCVCDNKFWQTSFDFWIRIDVLLHASNKTVVFMSLKLTTVLEILSCVIMLFIFAGDNDNERRKAVREKTSAYLVKAEFIADNFLSEKSHSKQMVKFWIFKNLTMVMKLFVLTK